MEIVTTDEEDGGSDHTNDDEDGDDGDDGERRRKPSSACCSCCCLLLITWVLAPYLPWHGAGYALGQKIGARFWHRRSGTCDFESANAPWASRAGLDRCTALDYRYAYPPSGCLCAEADGRCYESRCTGSRQMVFSYEHGGGGEECEGTPIEFVFIKDLDDCGWYGGVSHIPQSQEVEWCGRVSCQNATYPT